MCKASRAGARHDLLLAGALIAASTLSLYLARSGMGGLDAEEPVFDAGAINQRAELHAHFVLRNRAPREIDIIRVEPSCTCTDTTVSQIAVGPNETTTVTATIDTGESRGLFQTELVVLYVIRGENRLRALPLRVRADIAPHYDVTPTALEFDRTRAATKEVVIAARRDPVVNVRSAHANNSAFAVDIIDRAAEAGKSSILVHFDPVRLDDEMLNYALLIETDSEVQPTHTLPLRLVKTPKAQHPSIMGDDRVHP